MLETLEEAKHQPVDEDHLDHWRIAVDCAWGQLNKNYQRLDDCPVYYAAVALHPAFRWRYFETKWVDCPGLDIICEVQGEGLVRVQASKAAD